MNESLWHDFQDFVIAAGPLTVFVLVGFAGYKFCEELGFAVALWAAFLLATSAFLLAVILRDRSMHL